MTRYHVRLAPVTLLLALAACNGGMSAYPSIAQRPAERAFAQSGSLPPAPAPQGPGVADPATLRKVAALRADATLANARFTHDALDAARLTTAARGTGVGSESWAAATVAMGALDSARSTTALALADLDALQVATAVTAADRNDAGGAATYAAVADADREVAAILTSEDARILALHGSMQN